MHNVSRSLSFNIKLPDIVTSDNYTGTIKKNIYIYLFKTLLHIRKLELYIYSHVPVIGTGRIKEHTIDL